MWARQQSSSPTLAAALLPCLLLSFLLPRSAAEDVSGRPIIFHLIQQQFWTFGGDVTFHLEDSCIRNQAASQSVNQSLIKASVRLVADKTFFFFFSSSLSECFYFPCVFCFLPAPSPFGDKADYLCSLIHTFGSLTSLRCSQLTLQIRPALCQVVRRNQPEPSYVFFLSPGHDLQWQRRDGVHLTKTSLREKIMPDALAVEYRSTNIP